MPREAIITKIGAQFRIEGLSDFSIKEISDLQAIIGTYAYQRSMEISYLIKDLQTENLFKGEKNNATC